MKVVFLFVTLSLMRTLLYGQLSGSDRAVQECSAFDSDDHCYDCDECYLCCACTSSPYNMHKKLTIINNNNVNQTCNCGASLQPQPPQIVICNRTRLCPNGLIVGARLAFLGSGGPVTVSSPIVAIVVQAVEALGFAQFVRFELISTASINTHIAFGPGCDQCIVNNSSPSISACVVESTAGGGVIGNVGLFGALSSAERPIEALFCVQP